MSDSLNEYLEAFGDNLVSLQRFRIGVFRIEFSRLDSKMIQR